MNVFPHPAGITTLNRLRPDAWPRLEAELTRLSENCPVTLILPCHARELGTPALHAMIEELAGAAWLERIIIGLDGADSSEAARAETIFAALPSETHLLWTDSPAVKETEAGLQEAGLTTAASGKGRNVWLCSGLALSLAAGPAVVAVHDCDITGYSREIPGRLCLPLLQPGWGFRFNKGFYSRHGDRLHGRLQRLLVRPLLQAMELRAGPVPLLQFLSAFRYPLAGEAAMDAGLLRKLSLPATWGLEIGLLQEVRRQLPPPAVCQTELCGAYEHRHQELSPDDPSSGLHRMAREVASAVLATVSGGTYPWREQIVDTWQELAADALRQGAADSALNGLLHFPDDEMLAVRTFATALRHAVEQPDPPGLLPSWDAVDRLLPGAMTRLGTAVLR